MARYTEAEMDKKMEAAWAGVVAIQDLLNTVEPYIRSVELDAADIDVTAIRGNNRDANDLLIDVVDALETTESDILTISSASTDF